MSAPSRKGQVALLLLSSEYTECGRAVTQAHCKNYKVSGSSSCYAICRGWERQPGEKSTLHLLRNRHKSSCELVGVRWQCLRETECGPDVDASWCLATNCAIACSRPPGRGLSSSELWLVQHRTGTFVRGADAVVSDLPVTCQVSVPLVEPPSFWLGFSLAMSQARSSCKCFKVSIDLAG